MALEILSLPVRASSRYMNIYNKKKSEFYGHHRTNTNPKSYSMCVTYYPESDARKEIQLPAISDYIVHKIRQEFLKKSV